MDDDVPWRTPIASRAIARCPNPLRKPTSACNLPGHQRACFGDTLIAESLSHLDGAMPAWLTRRRDVEVHDADGRGSDRRFDSDGNVGPAFVQKLHDC